MRRKENNFAKICKNLGKYKSKNNFIGPHQNYIGSIMNYIGSTQAS